VVHGDDREDLVKEDGALRLVDDAADAVGRVPAWVGLLWLTALPSRLLLAFLCVRLLELGESAVHHAFWIRRMAFLLLCAWLLSLWGRQAFVRACRHAFQSSRPAPAALLRVPIREMAAHVASALAAEALFWATLVTVAAPPFVTLGAALAAAVPATAPSPRLALQAVWDAIAPFSRLVRLLLLFLLAVPIAGLNLHVLAHAIAWLASGFAGVDVAPWSAVLDLRNPTYTALLLTGAFLLLEPLWLASVAAHVERTRARSTGEDLRRWFSELRAAA
jgi:hypothetical protein